MTPCPTLLINLLSPQATYFLFPLVKKVFKGKRFVDVEEVKQTTAEALEGIKIHKFKNCFEQWKNILIGALHQMQNTWKVTEV